MHSQPIQMKINERLWGTSTCSQMHSTTLKWLECDQAFERHLCWKPSSGWGCLLRKFLYILVCSIARNSYLFHGREMCLIPRHNVSEVGKNTYYYHIGAMRALSLIHGGPAPGFITPATGLERWRWRQHLKMCQTKNEKQIAKGWHACTCTLYHNMYG